MRLGKSGLECQGLLQEDLREIIIFHFQKMAADIVKSIIPAYAEVTQSVGVEPFIPFGRGGIAVLPGECREQSVGVRVDRLQVHPDCERFTGVVEALQPDKRAGILGIEGRMVHP